MAPLNFLLLCVQGIICLSCRRWVYKNPMAGKKDVVEATSQPKPLLYSHMGMLATLPNGSLAAAWQVCTLERLCRAEHAYSVLSQSLPHFTDVNRYVTTLSFTPIGNAQGSEKWWEGSDEQGIYWAISEDGGASWGGHEILLAAPDDLPAWGPVLHTAVSWCIHLALAGLEPPNLRRLLRPCCAPS